MAEILKGKPVADAIKAELINRVEKLKTRGITPKLCIIRVGARPDDLFYEGGAKKTCQGVGMDAEVFEYPETIDQASFQIEQSGGREHKLSSIASLGLRRDIFFMN